MDAQTNVEVGDLLARFSRGDAIASEKLLALLYSELHTIARSCMSGQPPGHVLQATALVNEAYIRLSSRNGECWINRAHFLSTAARAMRCVLIDHARARTRRGLDACEEPSALDEIVVTYGDHAFDLLALDSALERLAQFDPLMARAVELRFFGGLGVQEVADILHISKMTLDRQWQATRAWLLQEVL